MYISEDRSTRRNTTGRWVSNEKNAGKDGGEITGDEMMMAAKRSSAGVRVCNSTFLITSII